MNTCNSCWIFCLFVENFNKSLKPRIKIWRLEFKAEIGKWKRKGKKGISALGQIHLHRPTTEFPFSAHSLSLPTPASRRAAGTRRHVGPGCQPPQILTQSLVSGTPRAGPFSSSQNPTRPSLVARRCNGRHAISAARLGHPQPELSGSDSVVEYKCRAVRPSCCPPCAVSCPSWAHREGDTEHAVAIDSSTYGRSEHEDGS
jgi:hypothetical protein